MIDWVSIVRHSRRRFSNYVYSVPLKVRKKRKPRRESDNPSSPHASNCSFCCDDNMQV